MYVIDGDTVGVGEQHFRLLKINAPEVSKARCQNELNQGLAAKERVEALIANAQNVEMTGKGYTDKYKRGLINLFVDGEDVGEILIREGLALKWRSGAAAKERYRRYWCG